MKTENEIKQEMASNEGFANWEQMEQDFKGKGLWGTIAAYRAKAAKIFSSNSVLSDSFLCALSDESRCKEQCFTCSEDQKCDEQHTKNLR